MYQQLEPNQIENSFIAIKNKKRRNKILIIIVIISIITISGIIFLNKNKLNFKEFSLFNQKTITSDSTKNKFLDNLAIETQEANLAKKILDQISISTDHNGFYGDYQTCDEEKNCQTNLFDYQKNGQSSASYRYGLSVAWARFKYFQKTNDRNQLTLLKKDLQNISSKVLDSQEWVLQTDSFNCLFMSDIINSDEIDEETKVFARRLCLEADFERAPDSNVSYDQHNHNLLTFFVNSEINPETTIEHLAVVPLPGEKQDSSLLKNFDSDELKKNINFTLTKLISGERTSTSSKVFNEEQPYFMTREIIAAIDQSFGAQITNASQSTQIAYLHHLILTDEVLSWFNANPNLFSNLDICLLKADLKIYLKDNSQIISPEKFDRILNYSELNFEDQLTCNLANNYSELKMKSSKKIFDDFQKLDKNHYWENGYIYPSGINNIFVINTNAILAGLLSQ